jgi:hypothetical protein
VTVAAPRLSGSAAARSSFRFPGEREPRRIGYPGAPPPWFASNTDAEPVAGGLRFLMKTSVRLARFWLASTPNLKLGFG